jgi:hypothetical protein
VCVYSRKESIAQVHGIAKDPLSGAGHPECLDISEQGLHVKYRLWPLLPLDLILGQEEADEPFPGVGQLIAFDIKFGDGGRPGKDTGLEGGT